MRRAIWLLQVVPLSVACSVALASAAAPPPELALMLDQHRFSPEELRIKANTPFIPVILSKDKEDEEFAISSLRIEQVVSGGKTFRFKLPALKPGAYKFVGISQEDCQGPYYG